MEKAIYELALSEYLILRDVLLVEFVLTSEVVYCLII